MSTKNFTDKELSCRCCGVNKMDDEFMDKLQDLRDRWGKPMVITSGYRCPKWNKESGGKQNSMHLHGRAADIYVDNGTDKYLLIRLAMEMGFNGLGVGSKFVHVDNRSIGVQCWTY